MLVSIRLAPRSSGRDHDDAEDDKRKARNVETRQRFLKICPTRQSDDDEAKRHVGIGTAQRRRLQQEYPKQRRDPVNEERGQAEGNNTAIKHRARPIDTICGKLEQDLAGCDQTDAEQGHQVINA